jgi:hypothetical protein
MSNGIIFVSTTTAHNTDRNGKKTFETGFERDSTKELTWVSCGYYNTECMNHRVADFDQAQSYFKEKYPAATFNQVDYQPIIAKISITFADELDEIEFIMKET